MVVTADGFHVAHTVDEARAIARRLGYPVSFRPAHAAGVMGLDRFVAHSEDMLADAIERAFTASTIGEIGIRQWPEEK